MVRAGIKDATPLEKAEARLAELQKEITGIKRFIKTYKKLDATSVVGNAVRVGRIATGTTEEQPPSAKYMGHKGGTARAKKLSPERPSEIAKKAARTRWSGPNS